MALNSSANLSEQFIIEYCEVNTAFGNAVVPDVYMMDATSPCEGLCASYQPAAVVSSSLPMSVTLTWAIFCPSNITPSTMTM